MRRNGETGFDSSLTSNDMSSWHYAFLFPQSPGPLHPATAVKHLAAFGAEFDGSIRMCISIDNYSHLLDVGEEVALSDPKELDIIRHLEEGRSFSIELQSRYLPLSVHFRMGTHNPPLSSAGHDAYSILHQNRFTKGFGPASESLLRSGPKGALAPIERHIHTPGRSNIR